MNKITVGLATAQPFQHRPERANEGVHTMEMSCAAGSRIADHDAGAVNGSYYRLFILLCRDQQLCLTFRFLIRILEALSELLITAEQNKQSIVASVYRPSIVI